MPYRPLKDKKYGTTTIKRACPTEDNNAAKRPMRATRVELVCTKCERRFACKDDIMHHRCKKGSFAESTVRCVSELAGARVGTYQLFRSHSLWHSQFVSNKCRRGRRRNPLYMVDRGRFEYLSSRCQKSTRRLPYKPSQRLSWLPSLLYNSPHRRPTPCSKSNSQSCQPSHHPCRSPMRRRRDRQRR